jgi:hypothetical protein
MTQHLHARFSQSAVSDPASTQTGPVTILVRHNHGSSTIAAHQVFLLKAPVKRSRLPDGCVGVLLQGVSMGVFSRAAANWEAGGYGALMSVPAAQPGLMAAIVPDHTLGCLKDNMLLLQDVSLVSAAHMAYDLFHGKGVLRRLLSAE